MQIIRTITQQQTLFCSWVSTPLKNIANRCAGVCAQSDCTPEKITHALQESMKELPQYALCYLLSPEGVIITPTISHTGNDLLDVNKDISTRPYFLEWSKSQEFMLSRPYISTKTNRHCMTAMQNIQIDGGVHAIIAIDFDGSSNNVFNGSVPERNHTQIKGDPSIRQQLFAQTRTIPPMEEQIDTVHQRAASLLHHHGAFFVQLRYSRSTATVRFTEHPYHDTVFNLEQLLTSDSNNQQPMSSMSHISAEELTDTLQLFKSLRFADENIYLRGGSINIITGMVELNFSCDGTHYLAVEEFLEKSAEFWLSGSATTVQESKTQEPEQQPPAYHSTTLDDGFIQQRVNP